MTSEQKELLELCKKCGYGSVNLEEQGAINLRSSDRTLEPMTFGTLRQAINWLKRQVNKRAHRELAWDPMLTRGHDDRAREKRRFRI